MPAKGTAEPNAAMTNQFRFAITGMPPIFFTRVSGLAFEVVTAELADRTKQTTGAVKTGDFEADSYAHHVTERLALEAWLAATATGAPTSKREGVLELLGANEIPIVSYLVVGAMLKMRKSPEMKAGDDGAAVLLTWSFDYDECIEL